MNIFRILFIVPFIFTLSCTKTIVKKKILSQQTANDTLLSVNFPKTNGDLYQFKILKNDSVFRSEQDYIDGKPTFDWFDSIYNIKATFENKHIKIGAHKEYEYIQKREVKHITHEDSTGFKTSYILKRLTQKYQDLEVSGITTSKHNLQFFLPKNTSSPVYELNFYSDKLEIYNQENNYFLNIIFGCCTSTSEFKLFDLKGKYILHSNDIIKSIKTENNHYLISVLKREVFDSPTIVIQDKNKRRQHVTISNIDHTMNYEENFYLKLKNKNRPETDAEFTPFKEYRLENLDDLEIWIPFGETDTLKIPFKNEKAFGVDYPQIKVQLTNTK